MVNFKKCNSKLSTYSPLGWVQRSSFCFKRGFLMKEMCLPPLRCSSDLEASGIASEAKLLYDESLGLDSKFRATIQSKLLHFLLADSHSWSHTRVNIFGKLERGSQRHRR